MLIAPILQAGWKLLRLRGIMRLLAPQEPRRRCKAHVGRQALVQGVDGTDALKGGASREEFDVGEWFERATAQNAVNALARAEAQRQLAQQCVQRRPFAGHAERCHRLR